MLYGQKYNHDVTYWGNPATNGYGAKTFDPPVNLKGRWEEKAERFIGQSGEDLVSQAVVYLEGDVDTNGYLYLGISTETNPTIINGAFKINAFNKIPDIRGLQFTRKALL
jgi:hypothetical protein